MPDSLPAPASAVPAVGIKNSITPALVSQLHQYTEGNIHKLPEWSLWLREQELFDRLTAKKEQSLQLKIRLAEHIEAEGNLAALRTERRKLASDLA